MPYIHKQGKDTIIFATKEDHATPSNISLPEPEPSPGAFLSTGEINWNCPCLGGLATGPCGLEFREAFSCFHYSTAEPKGSDCYEAFKTMQACMLEYPSLYGKKGASLDDLDEEEDSMEGHRKGGTEVPRLESEGKEVQHTSSIETGVQKSNA
ncbi:Mitochondrial intermembrane space import and assembly protein 40 [Eufriesea mexicana]|uniref:Mitochondrial intermembrane space import and assembly protein 40 n=1 Tax=Eufriesea mexicana TaxID=516756 RepID=A0A310SLH9_9HYME|nr:PREDICTED: mitochondrial intermembrane space import and assembly protein 40 [Eufriesea mexicana]OAD54409.1 Mitochondrial intermembrane space import and assembly protein 40 [Eufriesea mexicana]